MKHYSLLIPCFLMGSRSSGIAGLVSTLPKYLCKAVPCSAIGNVPSAKVDPRTRCSELPHYHSFSTSHRDLLIPAVQMSPNTDLFVRFRPDQRLLGMSWPSLLLLATGLVNSLRHVELCTQQNLTSHYLAFDLLLRAATHLLCLLPPPCQIPRPQTLRS